MILIKTQMQVIKIMNISIPCSLYNTYATNVSSKGLLPQRLLSLDVMASYTIWDRIKYVQRSFLPAWRRMLTDLYEGRSWNRKFIRVKKSRIEIIQTFLVHMYQCLTYIPFITKHIRENKQRLSCNEEQVNQIAEGLLDWDDATCVMKYEHLEKAERVVIHKILNISKSTLECNKYMNVYCDYRNALEAGPHNKRA